MQTDSQPIDVVEEIKSQFDSDEEAFEGYEMYKHRDLVDYFSSTEKFNVDITTTDLKVSPSYTSLVSASGETSFCSLSLRRMECRFSDCSPY